MASQNTSTQPTRCPVSGKGTGMQQCFQQADHSVIVEFRAGYAALSDDGRLGQVGQDGRLGQVGQGRRRPHCWP
jgi:hypothetical protein